MHVHVVDRSFEPLYGHPCWGVRFDNQTGLSMDFGDPRLEVREPTRSNAKGERVLRQFTKRLITLRGQWFLWVIFAHWKYSDNAERIATSSSSHRRICLAMSLLDGQKLVHVNVKPESGATCFTFDLGGLLEIRRFERDCDDELWSLYKPNGYVLTVHGNGTYDHEPESGTDKRRSIKQRDLAGS